MFFILSFHWTFSETAVRLSQRESWNTSKRSCRDGDGQLPHIFLHSRTSLNDGLQHQSAFSIIDAIANPGFGDRHAGLNGVVVSPTRVINGLITQRINVDSMSISGFAWMYGWFSYTQALYTAVSADITWAAKLSVSAGKFRTFYMACQATLFQCNVLRLRKVNAALSLKR